MILPRLLFRKTDQLSTKRARPSPLVDVAETVDVSPAAVASREELPVLPLLRMATELVRGCERGDSGAPGNPASLLRFRVQGTAVDRPPHRHGDAISEMEWKP